MDRVSNKKGSGARIVLSPKKLGVDRLQVFCDSQLVANQFLGEYQAQDERMFAYLLLVNNTLVEFEYAIIEQISTEHNSHMDIMPKLATALELDM